MDIVFQEDKHKVIHQKTTEQKGGKICIKEGVGEELFRTV